MSDSNNDPVNLPNGDSLLGMSDEDLMNLDPSSFDASDLEEEDEEESENAAPEGEAEEETADPEAEEAAAPAQADDADGDAEDDDDDEDDSESDSDDDDDSGSDDDEEDDGEEEEKPAPETEVDYKAEYEKILAPFKANGKELRVKSAEEAITLMQMGANYNKKMAGLKPNLKLLKLLENNELLDEQKLSYLVDLNKKDPEAIKKLVKDSGLDPLEINTDEESKYRPNTYTVHDREIELDTVLDELQDTPTYSRMIDVVSNKWDSASKQVVAESPQLLKVINDHMASGIYEQISKEMESERLFGRLVGMSDLEAYRHVGDAIQERGGFNHLSKGGAETAAEPKTVTPTPSTQKPDEAKRKDKKRAASATKAAGPAKDTEFNPLSMSDDEFEKVVQTNLM